MQMRVTLRVRCGSYKNETADGGHRAVSHFQIRDGGIRGMGALIQFPSFEGADGRLASCT